MRIKLLFCGGTISSAQERGIILPANKKGAEEYLRGAYPGIEFSCDYLINKHSENYSLNDIALIINSIKAAGDCDGAMVFCGTDTLAYLAAFLYYGLGETRKTVVLVSSFLPFGNPKSNAEANIDAAAAVCKSQKGGVFVCYKNRGEQTKVYTGNSLFSMQNFSDALRAYTRPYAIVNKGELIIKDSDLPACGDTLYDFTTLAPRVIVIVSLPGLDFSYFLNMAKLPKAFLVEAYHSSTACTAEEEYISSINTFAKECAARGTDVYLSGYEKRKSYYLSSLSLAPEINKMSLPTPALYAMLTLKYNSH